MMIFQFVMCVAFAKSVVKLSSPSVCENVRIMRFDNCVLLTGDETFDFLPH